MNTHKNSNKNKKLILLSMAVLLVAAAAYVLEKKKITNFYERTPAIVATDSQQTINLDPPTTQEQSAGDIQKESLIASEKQTESPTSIAESAKDVTIVIVDAAQYDQEVEVRAFVSNHVEAGECTFTFSQSTVNFTRTTPASADASSSPCITLILPTSDFPSIGSWDLDITYKSSTAQGTARTKIEVR